jgi:hypothetical protein
MEEAVELAAVRTRRFAVRQERWFARDPRIRWFDQPDAAHVIEAVDAWWAECAAAGVGSTATVGRNRPDAARSDDI